MVLNSLAASASLMNLKVISYDVGTSYSSVSDWVKSIEKDVSDALEGHQIIVYPELFSLSLGSIVSFANEKDLLKQVSKIYWSELVPKIEKLSSLRKPSLIVLGSAPFFEPDKNVIFNRSAVIRNGELLFQDKIHLTPWESSFVPGRELKLFTFEGMKVAITICLDIEMPQIAYTLQKEGVEIIIVPSATEGMLGSQRIHRTASGRAVETGALVFVAPLLGKNQKVELISSSLGQIARYAPSNQVFDPQEQIQLSDVLYGNGHQTKSFDIPVSKVKAVKEKTQETKPFYLFKKESLKVSKQ